MNKIYKAFDSIKLDGKIKSKAYQNVRRRQRTNNYIDIRKLIYGIFGLAVTTVFIFLFVNAENND